MKGHDFVQGTLGICIWLCRGTALSLGCRFWHIAKLFSNARLGCYHGLVDIGQASSRSTWLKLPTNRSTLPCDTVRCSRPLWRIASGRSVDTKVEKAMSTARIRRSRHFACSVATDDHSSFTPVC
jgi:hypothetical protein